jgi:Spy/CpxP family protein refolding chaperone
MKNNKKVMNAMNQKNYKILVWLVLILLVLNISALGTFLWFHFAQKPPQVENLRNQKNCFRMHEDFIREGVGLNEEQLTQFIAIRDKHFEEIKIISEEVQNTRKYQFQQVRKGGVPVATIDSLNQRIGELHSQWAESSTRFLIGTSELCTPEQRDKMFDLFEKSRKEKKFRSMKHFNGSKCVRDTMECPGDRKPQRGRYLFKEVQ